jgi:hypothetical protein
VGVEEELQVEVEVGEWEETSRWTVLENTFYDDGASNSFQTAYYNFHD